MPHTHTDSIVMEESPFTTDGVDYRRQLGKPQPRIEPSPQWQHRDRFILHNLQRATSYQNLCQPSPQTPTQRTNQYQLYRETSNITQRQTRQTLHLPQPTEEILTMLKSPPFYFFKIGTIHAFIASYTHPKLILAGASIGLVETSLYALPTRYQDLRDSDTNTPRRLVFLRSDHCHQ